METIQVATVADLVSAMEIQKRTCEHKTQNELPFGIKEAEKKACFHLKNGDVRAANSYEEYRRRSLEELKELGMTLAVCKLNESVISFALRIRTAKARDLMEDCVTLLTHPEEWIFNAAVRSLEETQDLPQFANIRLPTARRIIVEARDCFRQALEPPKKN